MKHVGKMKNNGARVGVVFRTLPGEVQSALVVGTVGLPDIYHDNLMSVLESDSGQQANELADILAVRKFPDGNGMLEWLHTNGHLKKVPTNNVLMTPDTKTQILLTELNKLIAEQKGISVEDLNPAPEGSVVETSNEDAASEYTGKPSSKATAKSSAKTFEFTSEELRQMADDHAKKAEALRAQADAQDKPVVEEPKKKTMRPVRRRQNVNA